MSTKHRPTCISIENSIPHLRDRYAKLAIVSDRRHLDAFDASASDTLVVSCEWLLWQEEVSVGRHCVFYERGIRHAGDDAVKTIADDVIVMSNDWLYCDGEDMTQFMGVSLGAQFSTDLALSISSYVKLRTAIEGLVEEFRPKEILFVDFRLERFNPDLERRIGIVEELAAERGITFTDLSDSAEHDGESLASDPAPWIGAVRRRSAREKVISVYQTMVDWIFRFRRFALGRQRTVLIWLGQNLTIPLIEGFSSSRLYPVCPALSMPKTSRFLWRCFMRGVLLAGLPRPRLTRREIAEMERIQQRVAAAHARPASGLVRHMLEHVRKHLLGSGRFEQAAREVKGCRKLLGRYRPDRIVIDGVKNPPGRILIELASARNIAIEYTWHAPMAPQNLRFDALGSDPRMDPIVTRCLSWGQINDDWLDRIGATVPRVRSGNPILGRYRRDAKDHNDRSGNALVLQYAAIHSDAKSLNAVQYSYFVDVVRMLMDEGFTNIRMKLHPGHWRVAYFENIARRFGLDCTVHKDEPFRDMVDWAEFAIGPVHSGAMLEVLAANKDYHAMLIPPTSLDGSYLGVVDLHTNVESVRRAIRDGNHCKKSAILNAYCSSAEIPDPVARFWDIVEHASTDRVGDAIPNIAAAE